MTKQREAILRVIRSSPEHLTAEQVFLQVKRDLPTIAMATVYNNLNAMDKAGLVRRLTFSGSPDRYDKSTVPHAHLLCDGCGAISDVDCPDVQRYLETQLMQPVHTYELNVHVLCSQCRKTTKH